MSSIMDIIGTGLFELSALEVENLPYLTLFTSANIDQSVANLATIYLPIRSRRSSIMKQIKQEHPELFAFEFGKIAETDFVYTLASPISEQNCLSYLRLNLQKLLNLTLVML